MTLFSRGHGPKKVSHCVSSGLQFRPHQKNKICVFPSLENRDPPKEYIVCLVSGTNQKSEKQTKTRELLLGKCMCVHRCPFWFNQGDPTKKRDVLLFWRRPRGPTMCIGCPIGSTNTKQGGATSGKVCVCIGCLFSAQQRGPHHKLGCCRSPSKKLNFLLGKRT